MYFETSLLASFPVMQIPSVLAVVMMLLLDNVNNIPANHTIDHTPAEEKAMPARPKGESVEKKYYADSNVDGLESKILPLDIEFSLLKLPLGVSVEFPADWHVLDSGVNTAIQSARKAIFDLSGLEAPYNKRTNLFRANAMSEESYASIAINIIDSKENIHALRNASKEEIAALTPIMHEYMDRGMRQVSVEIKKFYEVRRKFIGDNPAIMIKYIRSGPTGDVTVQQTHLYLRGKMMELNLAYRESDAHIWKPIIQYICDSLKVE